MQSQVDIQNITCDIVPLVWKDYDSNNILLQINGKDALQKMNFMIKYR